MLTKYLYYVIIRCCSNTFEGIENSMLRTFFEIENENEIRDRMINFNHTQEGEPFDLQLKKIAGQDRDQPFSIKNITLTYVKVMKLKQRTQFSAEGYGDYEGNQRFFAIDGTENSSRELSMILSLR